MKLTFDPTSGHINPDFSAILSHHDVVFRAPTHDPLYGLPIGNGDLGCLLYTEADRLHIHINKTDLWDDTQSPDDTFCTMETENLTVCRHGARLTLDFGAPVFEMLFQNRYEGRISLYDGTAVLCADTPFAKTALTAFVSEASSVAVLSLDLAFSEELPLTATLQRFGSRTQWFWYSYFRAGTEFGLDGTSADTENGILHIRQELNGTSFCVALLPVSRALSAMSAAGSHTARAVYDAEKHHQITFYMTIAAAGCMEDAVTEADRLVTDAAAQGYDALYAEHSRRWAEFWSKSYVSLPFDYLENLWYLNLYYANSQMKGKYPAHFCNGLWNFYHDFVPWNHYFHYNMQLACFPLEEAGHPELLDTYFDFRVRQLPRAKAYAREYRNSDGAFYGDVCDRHGRGDRGVGDNCTCGPQIAMMLYKHYLFSGDRDYLQNKALPVMRACAQYYIELLTPGEDGYYHVLGTTGYEGSPLLDDSITDYAAIRALFGALCDVLPADASAPYRERLEKLAPYRMTDMLDDEYENGIFTRGIGQGTASRGNQVLYAGRYHGTDNWIRKTHGNAEHDYYGFPDVEMAPVYPSGTLGLADRGTKLYDAVYNSCCLHHPALFEGNALGRDARDGVCMGWCMEPIYLARMGMSELLFTDFENTINTWMELPQGFGYYTPSDHSHLNRRWDLYEMNDPTGEGKVHVPAWNFRHFDYETLPVLSAAVNEMLLQSYDGVVRLFCAVQREKAYAFRLYAQGGFVVEAAYDRGRFSAKITSQRGGRLSLAAENMDEDFIVKDSDGIILAGCRATEVYQIETVPGQVLYVSNADGMMLERDYDRNDGPKVFGDVKLGQYEALK